jgi:ABC-type transport system involved in multi-copper enzyme maturation permease subunit
VICSGLLISSNIVLAAVKAADARFPYATTKFSLANFYTSFAVVFFLCICIASLVFGNEYFNHTFKNNISYGITRGQIYFGKLIVEIIYSLTAFIVITGCHVASAYILLDNSGPEHLTLLLKTSVTVLPLLIYALAAANCFLFIIESTGAAIGAVIGLLLALPQISNLLGMKFTIFRMLSKILPFNMINNMGYDFEKCKLILPWEGAIGYYNYWIYGLAEFVIIMLIGFVVFRKKEIK